MMQIVYPYRDPRVIESMERLRQIVQGIAAASRMAIINLTMRTSQERGLRR